MKRLLSMNSYNFVSTLWITVPVKTLSFILFKLHYSKVHLL